MEPCASNYERFDVSFNHETSAQFLKFHLVGVLWRSYFLKATPRPVLSFYSIANSESSQPLYLFSGNNSLFRYSKKYRNFRYSFSKIQCPSLFRRCMYSYVQYTLFKQSGKISVGDRKRQDKHLSSYYDPVVKNEN